MKGNKQYCSVSIGSQLLASECFVVSFRKFQCNIACDKVREFKIFFFLRSPLVGFLRFLHLLSSTDWQTTPIILNFNNDFSGES